MVYTDSRTNGSRKGGPNYSREFKQQLVEAANQPVLSVSKLARAHGVNANLLFKWRCDAKAEPPALYPIAYFGDSDHPFRTNRSLLDSVLGYYSRWSLRNPNSDPAQTEQKAIKLFQSMELAGSRPEKSGAKPAVQLRQNTRHITPPENYVSCLLNGKDSQEYIKAMGVVESANQPKRFTPQHMAGCGDVVVITFIWRK